MFRPFDQTYIKPAPQLFIIRPPVYALQNLNEFSLENIQPDL